jgi:hypothetical protein
MKNLKRFLVPIIAITLGSCTSMSKTSTNTENLGNVIYSVEWSNPKRTFVQADSTSFIVKGHANVQPGDMCLRGYKENIIPKEGIEYSKEYKLAGKED